MIKLLPIFLLLGLLPLISYAQGDELPVNIFDVEATTDVHYPDNASDLEIAWIERRESALYITEKLHAEILKEVSIEEEIDQKGYSFVIYQDSSYWLIRIKPLKPYKYGIFEYRELEQDESPILEYNSEFHRYLKAQLDLIDQFKDEGDLLGAARGANYVIGKSEDSLLVAEAFYKLMEVGLLVANRFNERIKSRQVLDEFNSLARDYKHANELDWQELFGLHNKSELELFRAEGIILGIAKWSDQYVSDRSEILLNLSENYSSTKWGELASLTMLTDDGNGYGLATYGIESIDRAYAFLQRYPESEHKSWVYTVLWQSYSDMLRMINCDEKESSAREWREGAIKYLLLSGAESDWQTVQDLKEGKCPEFYYRFSD